ncbi:unnamed protein product [Gongylonema pulchrum]|uniref:RNA uridylyltransferase n=1 Tax=Gongylonema pulchrum TaxID=637853 RepID=A0A183EVK7_9BILA|nr:unnamed protein product [Gongylonema pulchrum]
MQYMRDVCHELQKILQQKFRPDCQLTLFGSAGNGFGLIGSDADMCLQFGADVKPDDLCAALVITEVARVLRKVSHISQVTEIPHAKVPIVKLRYHGRQLMDAE